MDKAARAVISRKAGNSAVVGYAWLCFYANYKAQNCFPSVTTLAEHSNLSRRMVMRLILKLEEIQVIMTEREHGKPNVYKLLDVKENTVFPTGDTHVTSDTGDTGVVSPMSPALVTPGTLEQEIYEQDISNKAASCLFDAWKDAKLPYPCPTFEEIKQLNDLCQRLMEEVNLYKFIFDFQGKRGYPPPPDALLNACRRFEQEKHRIENPWGWFHDMIGYKSRDYFADAQVKAHVAIKNEPAALGDILRTSLAGGP